MSNSIWKISENLSHKSIIQILEECHLKFPEYTIYDNMEIAESAAKASRATEESLLGVIHDIHMLSLTDFVVCTHSSNVRTDCIYISL